MLSLACARSERPAIDQALVAGEPLRNIAERVSISPESLLRHKSHVSQAIEKASEKRQESSGKACSIKCSENNAKRGKCAEERLSSRLKYSTLTTCRKPGGRCLAGLASGLAFEDSNGVIRVMSSDGRFARFVLQFTGN